MKITTLVLLLVVFVVSAVCGTILVIHGSMPASALITILTGGMMGAFGIAEPGGAAGAVAGLLGGAKPGAVEALVKDARGGFRLRWTAAAIVALSALCAVVAACAGLTAAQKATAQRDDTVAIRLTGAACAPLEAAGLSPYVAVACVLAEDAEAWVGTEIAGLPTLGDAGHDSGIVVTLARPPAVAQQIRARVPRAQLPAFLAAHPSRGGVVAPQAAVVPAPSSP